MGVLIDIKDFFQNVQGCQRKWHPIDSESAVFKVTETEMKMLLCKKKHLCLKSGLQ
jgi:hypothetical protein